MIYQKLASVQEALKVPKDQNNDFGKYKYRSCEDILSKAKEHYIPLGMMLNLTDDIVMIGDWHYVKATATIMDSETGESISSVAFARESLAKKGMDEAQVTGSASSYARKYALCGLFCIDDSKLEQSIDPDAQDNRLICEECRNKITDIKVKDRVLTASEIAAKSKEKYGRCLCYICSKAANESKQG